MKFDDMAKKCIMISIFNCIFETSTNLVKYSKKYSKIPPSLPNSLYKLDKSLSSLPVYCATCQ